MQNNQRGFGPTKLRKGKTMTKSDYAILIIFGFIMVVAGMNIESMMVIQ